MSNGASDSGRRRFLKAISLGSAGFLIGCDSRVEAPEGLALAQEIPTHVAELEELNAFIAIGSDNSVTVTIKHLDMGQGLTTGFPAIVAEELDADWSQMRSRFAPADVTRYRNLMFSSKQATGGSTSLANSWMQLREAAAGARDLLVRAAAARWQVGVSDIRVASGVLTSGDNRATFGELASDAGQLVPADAVQLKEVADFKVIGQRWPRLDSVAKTNGTAQYTVDLVRPNMQVAVVARSPRFGGKLLSFDAGAALKVAGVSRVVEIPRGVAVLADSYWSALAGRQALVLDWDDRSAEARSSAEIRAEFTDLLDVSGLVSRDDGDSAAAFQNAATVVEADFHFPFLAHAAMEPLDCIVELEPGRCEVWTASQQPSVDQAKVAELTGLSIADVTINTIMAGGSFGRRSPSDCDFVAEAVSIAVAIDGEYAIKLQWSREDDFSGGRYRPMASHRFRAAIDDKGKLVGWQQRVASQSILRGTSAEKFMKDGLDPTAVEGSHHLPYAIENFFLDVHIVDTKVPMLWWRSVGHSHNAYATEVFVDKIANAVGRDPYKFRRQLLEGQERFLGVLDLVAEKADWGAPLGAGRGRGIALQKSFGSYAAQVAEVSVASNGELTIDRVVCAIDCGVAINPDVIRAQMEGGIGHGISMALREEITLTKGVVDQQNFHRYQPLRISEMPAIEVHIVPSTEAPSGVGEPGLPPAAPAVANAIANATGVVLQDLPFADQLEKRLGEINA